MRGTGNDCEIKKCSAAIRRGIENYRDYDYCEEFLDRLSDQAGLRGPRMTESARAGLCLQRLHGIGVLRRPSGVRS